MELVNLKHKTMNLFYKNMTLLSTLEDLEEYIKFYEDDVKKVTTKVLKSNVPSSRYDHLYFTSPAGLAFMAGVQVCKIRGGIPFIEMDKAGEEMINNKGKAIINGKIVVQNPNGSYFTVENLDDYEVQVLSDKVTFEVPKVFHVGTNPKYINLENDPDLEEHTKNFMKENDENFSYILNLRNFYNNDLEVIFKRFVYRGGKSLYLYTTGLDIEQMRNYIQVAIDSGIKEGLFEFNAGENPEIINVMEEFNSKMNIQYKFL